MIGTPYLAFGAAGAIVAAAAGGYFHGRHVEKGEWQGKQLHELTVALENARKGDLRIAVLERQAGERENQRQVKVREVYVEIPKIVRDPVYRNRCLNDDGVLLLDRARAAANGGGDPGTAAGGAGSGSADRANDRPGDGPGKR